MNVAASSAQVSSDQVAVDQVARAQWRRVLLPSLLLLAAFSIALYPTTYSLLELWWNHGSYGHGLLVVGVCVYLIYLRRAELAQVVPTTNWFGFVLASGLIAAWFASTILGVLIGEQMTWVLLVAALVLALYGYRAARILVLPILYLYTAVPIWSYLVPMLQDNTAEYSTSIIRAVGVPVFLEGLYMTIPDGRFLVAEVCSGLSYLLAGLSLGAFYALLNLRRPSLRLAMIVFSLVMGVIFNWVRVAGIVVAGHYTQMQSVLVKDHIAYGWVLFILVVGAIIYFGRILERFDTADDVSQPQRANLESVARTSSRSTWLMAIVSSLLLVVSAMAAVQWLAVPDNNVELVLPSTIGDDSNTWRILNTSQDEWAAVLTGPDSQARTTYSKAGQGLDLQIGYFAVQRQAAEAVNGQHEFFEPENWRRIDEKARPDRVPVRDDLSVNEVLVVHTAQRDNSRVIWWWYWVNGELTGDPVSAKLLQVKSLLSGRKAAAVLVLSAPVEQSVQATREAMKRWFSDAEQPVGEALQALSQ